MDIVKYNKHILENNIPTVLWSYNTFKDIAEEYPVQEEVEETLFNNTYSRTLLMPKDSLAIGRMHKQSAYNIVLKGKVIIHMMGKTMYFEAGDSFISPAFSKKVLRAVEDTKFMNIFTVNSTSIEDVLDEVTFSEEKEINLYKELLWQQ